MRTSLSWTWKAWLLVLCSCGDGGTETATPADFVVTNATQDVVYVADHSGCGATWTLQRQQGSGWQAVKVPEQGSGCGCDPSMFCEPSANASAVPAGQSITFDWDGQLAEGGCGDPCTAAPAGRYRVTVSYTRNRPCPEAPADAAQVESFHCPSCPIYKFCDFLAFSDVTVSAEFDHPGTAVVALRLQAN